MRFVGGATSFLEVLTTQQQYFSSELQLEQADGLQKIAMNGSGAIVVPRGVWHTARVFAPSRMLHVTRGAGTEVRPA